MPLSPAPRSARRTSTRPGVEGLEARALLAAITEFDLPLVLASTQPGAITTGSDGNLWFTNNATNAIDRITPTGQATSFPLAEADATASSIAPGPDGSLVFVETSPTSGDRIGRITTGGQVTSFPLPAGSSVNTYAGGGITAGPDGNVWFIDRGQGFGLRGNYRVGRITPSGLVTEFPIPAYPFVVSDIVAGFDGNLWFTEGEAIGRITPDGQFAVFPLPADPSIYSHYAFSITPGPDGALWFIEKDAGRIGRITMSGQIQEFPVPSMPNNLTRITAGPDGALYFLGTYESPVYRITIGGVISQLLDFTNSGGLNGITDGPDGALWITQSDGRVARVTPSGGLTEFPIPTVGRPSGPSAIAAGPDGAVWFSVAPPDFLGGDDEIGRIDSSGAVTLFPLPAGTSGVNSLATGPDGNLWFTLSQGIGRITTAGVVTLFPLVEPGFQAQDIAAGPDGALWFTEVLFNNQDDTLTSSRVGRISTDGRITEFPIPPNPAGGIAYGAGAIVTGADGNLWFRAGQSIGRITTAGAITLFPVPMPQDLPGGFAPEDGIAAGPDDALWFPYANSIGRITTSGVVTLFPYPRDGSNIGYFVGNIATGSDQNLWIAGYDQIQRVTPEGTVTLLAIPTIANGTQKIAAGPDGDLYFTEPYSGKIGRVNLNPAVGAAPPAAPAVSLDTPGAVSLGSPFVEAGAFASPALGPFTATVDYGDGSGKQPLAVGPDRTFLLTHLYVASGLYGVEVDVLDQDGTIGTRSISVTVVATTALPQGPGFPSANPPAASGFGVDRDASVRVLYRDLLGREVEAGGLLFWSTRLAAGEGLMQVARSIRGSVESRSLSRQGRSPQVSLARAYTDALHAGREAVSSPTSLPPTTDASGPSGLGADRDAFVRTIYRERLGRDAEADGLLFWSTRLALGDDPRQVAESIGGSAEFRSLQRQGRAPQVGLSKAYADALRAGRTVVFQATPHPVSPATNLAGPAGKSTR